MARVLVIDSYDSFVYNLVQYLGELGADPTVVRNDALSVDEALALAPDAVLLSPGPGRPEDAGILPAAIPAFAASAARMALVPPPADTISSRVSGCDDGRNLPGVHLGQGRSRFKRFEIVS